MTESTFELEPWDERGRAMLTAVGPSVLEAMSAALAGVLAAMGQRDGSGDGGGRSAPLRAEADDLPSIVVGIVASLAGQIESLDMQVHAASVEGLVRSDTGYVAWGVAHLGSGPAASGMLVELESSPDVTELGDGTRIRARLLRARPEGE